MIETSDSFSRDDAPIPASGRGSSSFRTVSLAGSRGKGRTLAEGIEKAGREIDRAEGQPSELIGRERKSGLLHGITSLVLAV